MSWLPGVAKKVKSAWGYLSYPSHYPYQDLQERLVAHEGYKNKPYFDTKKKITIGVGRNLSDVGLSEDEIIMLLRNDIERSVNQLKPYAWFTALDKVRQDACAEMVFNLGLKGFLGFSDAINAIALHEYKIAAAELKDSKWATQVAQSRVADVCYRIEFGRYLGPGRSNEDKLSKAKAIES